MERKIKKMFLNYAIPILCYVLVGILFIGGFILQPNNNAFTFTIFGFAAILFYNLVIQYSIRSFILDGLLFSLLTLVFFMPSENIIVILRNLNWFILIGVLAFSISYYEKKVWYKASKVWTIISWFIGFIIVYLIMSFLNIYVYQLYYIDERIGLLFYVKEAVKIGGVLGLGIGLGNIVLQTFSKNNI